MHESYWSLIQIQIQIQIQTKDRQLMEAQKLNVSETHNLMLTTFLASHQMKHMSFNKLEHHKTLYRKGIECKYLTSLIMASRNLLKIYAIFQNDVIEELGVWRLYEDITGIYTWDKIIVVETSKKIVGLTYNESMLKNVFMLTLEFIPLNPLDQCQTLVDRLGYYLVTYIRNTLIICFSDSVIQKYRSKPLYREGIQLIEQDVKWNEPSKNHISEIMKINLSELKFLKIQNLQLHQDILYFKGHISPIECHIYSIQLTDFFNPIVPSPSYATSPKINKGFINHLTVYQKDVSLQNIYILQQNITKDHLQYLFLKGREIYLQTIKNMMLIYQLLESQDSYTILNDITNPVTIFPLLLLIKNKALQSTNLHLYVLKILKKQKNYMNLYDISTIILPLKNCPQKCLLKDSFLILSNTTEVTYLNLITTSIKNINNNLNQYSYPLQYFTSKSLTLHRSIGNIIDFHLEKNILFIQNTQDTQNKVYQICKTFKIDQKPYVTHKKKIWLQEYENYSEIKSINLQNKSNQKQICLNIIIIKDAKSNNFSIYKQTQHLFQLQYDCIIYYSKYVQNSSEGILLIQQHNNYEEGITFKLFYTTFTTINQQFIGYTLKKELAFAKKWILGDYMLIQMENSISQYQHVQGLQDRGRQDRGQQDILQFICLNLTKQQKQLYIKITIPNLSETQKSHKYNYLNFSIKESTFKKKDKEHLILQLFVVNQRNFYIFQILLKTSEYKLSFWNNNIVEGLGFLRNQINSNGEKINSMSNLLQNNEGPNQKKQYNKDKYRSITDLEYCLGENIHKTTIDEPSIKTFIKVSYLYTYNHITLLIFITNDDQLLAYQKYLCFQSQLGYLFKRVKFNLNFIKGFKTGKDDKMLFADLGENVIKVGNFMLFQGQFLEFPPFWKSFFRMDNSIWALIVITNDNKNENKIRILDFKGFAYSNLILTPIETTIKTELMGIESSNNFYCVYSRSSFEILNKEYISQWKPNLISQMTGHNETIISLKMFDNYLAMSYYDYFQNENHTVDYQSVRFKFKIYNIFTKNKIVEKEKAMDEPIIHIRFMAPDKLILATSSTIFINTFKNDRGLELTRTHNFQSKRTFLSTFAYIPDVLPSKIGQESKPGYMLFGGSHGGLSFFVGKWIQENKLKENWFESFKCNMKEIQFSYYAGQLKAIIADEDENLIALNIKNDCAQKIGDINLGAKVNAFKSRIFKNELVFMCLTDGNIKVLSPIKLDNLEISYLDFQDTFCKELPFIGGFNLRASRSLKQQYRSFKMLSKGNILDGDLLEDFFALTNSLKEHLVNQSELEITQIKSHLI